MNISIASWKKARNKMPETTGVYLHRSMAIQKALLFCGILSSLWYVAINIFVPMYFPGYNSSSQTVSELSAVDAPTRQLWVWLAIPYTLLVVAFGWGMEIGWQQSPPPHSGRLVDGLWCIRYPLAFCSYAPS